MMQMWGWFRLEAARASRWKRSSRLAVPGKLFGQELECDESAELDVLSLVDDTHATAA